MTPNSEFGIAVGLRPTRRTVACGRIIASSFGRGLIRLSSRRRVRNSEWPQPAPGNTGGRPGTQNSKFTTQNWRARDRGAAS
jgi:hypothetical protein